MGVPVCVCVCVQVLEERSLKQRSELAQAQQAAKRDREQARAMASLAKQYEDATQVSCTWTHCNTQKSVLLAGRCCRLHVLACAVLAARCACACDFVLAAPSGSGAGLPSRLRAAHAASRHSSRQARGTGTCAPCPVLRTRNDNTHATRCTMIDYSHRSGPTRHSPSRI